MEIGIKISATLKNNEFYKARIRKGFIVFNDFVKEYNSQYSYISYQTLLSYENMTKIPSFETAKKISKLLDIEVEIIFPAIMGKTIKQLKKVNKKIYLIEEAEKLISGQRDVENIFIYDLRNSINKCLNTLENIEKNVINLRFIENKTLEKVGEEMNLSRERVRQIEGKALRKLRHPERNKFLEYYKGEF